VCGAPRGSSARDSRVCTSGAASPEGEAGGWGRDREHESANVWSLKNVGVKRGGGFREMCTPCLRAAGQRCQDGMMRLHAGIPPAPFLVADPAGNAQRDDWPCKAALPKDGFNLISPHLLLPDLSAGAAWGVLEHSSHHPLSCRKHGAPCAPGY